jgi:uncharacterized protein (DUF1800 family)
LSILGATRKFDAISLVEFLVGQEACARFIASRLWFRYGSTNRPIPATTRETMMSAFPDSVMMLRALFTDDAFRSTGRSLVKQPVEWFVGAMRQLGGKLGNQPPATVTQILYGLERLGQLPFAPPSVKGWPGGLAWLTSGSAQVRLGLATKLAAQANVSRLTPESLAHLLAVEKWTDRTYAALRGVSDTRRLLTLGLASPEYLVT